MHTASKTYITRTIARLYGMIEGITIDCRLNDMEITRLFNWMETHGFLTDIEPFRGLWSLLNDILEDQVIDSDEKKALLEWCAEALNERGFIEGFTPVLRSIHGILGGILADEKITADELKGLQDWLIDYEKYEDWWPISEISALIKNILKNKLINEKEHKKLSEFFQDFSEHPLEHVKTHDEEYHPGNLLGSHAPFFMPIATICEKNPRIEFHEKKFCFTGPAVSGSRKVLSGIVVQLGGFAHNNIVNGLDYLVIGAQSSPAWAYSTYGRKIESAMQKNKKTKFIHIIQEKDFVRAALDEGGQNFFPKSKAMQFSQNL